MRRSAAAMAATLALTAGCTSSGSTPATTSPATQPTSPSTSSSPAPTTAPATAPASSSSAPPLSKFEADPAVKALRAWAAQAAITVNSGHYDSPALDALMTTQLRTTIKNILGNSVGYRYPGPLPFTPVAVPEISATQRRVNTCFVTNGFGIDPKTGKPHGTYKVTAIEAGAQLRNGKWLVDLFTVGAFSCTGVTVRRSGA